MKQDTKIKHPKQKILYMGKKGKERKKKKEKQRIMKSK